MNHTAALTQTLNNACCCFSFRKITRAITQFYDRHLELSGIRATQFTLLVELTNSKAKTLTEIAEGLVMDRTTLTRNLRPLEKLGFIITKEVFDKRSKAYALTASGHDAVMKGLPLWEQAQKHILSVVGHDRYHHLIKEFEVVKRAVTAPRPQTKRQKKEKVHSL